MSYVLDALRKSEQDRQVAAGQSASVLYPVMVASRRGLPWKALAISAAVLLVAVLALAGWWLRMPVSAPHPTVVAEAAPVAKPVPTPAAPVSATVPVPVPPPVAVETLSPPPVVRVVPGRPLPVAAPVPAPVAAPAPAKSTAKAPIEAPRRPAPLPVAKAEPPATAEAAKPVAGGDNRDLPAALQRELPRIEVAGYINDADGSSMAMINDKLVREGEEVAPGLRLEKILGDGALFSYKGHRFRR